MADLSCISSEVVTFGAGDATKVLTVPTDAVAVQFYCANVAQNYFFDVLIAAVIHRYAIFAVFGATWMSMPLIFIPRNIAGFTSYNLTKNAAGAETAIANYLG